MKESGILIPRGFLFGANEIEKRLDPGNGCLVQIGKVHPQTEPFFELVIHRDLAGKIVFQGLFQIFVEKFAEDVFAVLNDQMQQGDGQQVVFLS